MADVEHRKLIAIRRIAQKLQRGETEKSRQERSSQNEGAPPLPASLLTRTCRFTWLSCDGSPILAHARKPVASLLRQSVARGRCLQQLKIRDDIAHSLGTTFGSRCIIFAMRSLRPWGTRPGSSGGAVAVRIFEISAESVLALNGGRPLASAWSVAPKE